MKLDEKIEMLMMDYIDKTISHADLIYLKNYLQKNKQDLSDLNNLQDMMNDLDKLQVPSVSTELDARLNHHINQSKKIHKWIPKQKYLAVAIYTIIVLGAGTLLGSLFSDNSSVEKQIELSSMLKNEISVSHRIQAVSLYSGSTSIDDLIAEVLLETLNNDPNINVRLSALSTLAEYDKNDKVRTGLVGSILQQESGIVQIALLNVMIDWKEKSSIKKFKKLLERQEMESLVVNHIESGIEKI